MVRIDGSWALQFPYLAKKEKVGNLLLVPQISVFEVLLAHEIQKFLPSGFSLRDLLIRSLSGSLPHSGTASDPKPVPCGPHAQGLPTEF